MNFYMLVEGNKSEKIFYPALFQYYKPGYSEVKELKNICKNNFYIFPGGGMPDIKNKIQPSLSDIKDFNEKNEEHIDCFVIVIDGDRFSDLNGANQCINDVLKKNESLTKGIKIIQVIQNKCLESWLLANTNLFPTKFDNNFAKLVDIYDIRESDPENLPKIEGKSYGNSAKYYLREMLKQSGKYYSESCLDDVLQDGCIPTIERRYKEQNHIQSFQSIMDFIDIL